MKKQRVIDLILKSDKYTFRVRSLALLYRQTYKEHIGRSTINRALTELANEGIIEKSTGLKGKNTCWRKCKAQGWT